MRVPVGIAGVEDSHYVFILSADVDAREAVKIRCLYYSLRSDAKTRLCPWWLLHAWNLLTLLLAAWTLGASVIPQGVMRNLSVGISVVLYLGSRC